MANGGSQEVASGAEWRPWHYVLAGAGVILAISAVTIVTSVILRPTHVSFSVAGFDADDHNYRTDDPLQLEVEEGRRAFAFNLTAHNPSRRVGVVYRYVLVSLQMASSAGGVRKTWVPARVVMADGRELSPDHQEIQQRRGPHDTNMTVQAVLDDDFFGFYSSSASATVRVFAQAQFKVGLARSRAYNLRLTCSRIDLASVNKTHPGVASCSYLP